MSHPELLNVYRLRPTEPYSGGALLLAGTSAAHAIRAHMARPGAWHFDASEWSAPTLVPDLHYAGAPGVIADWSHRE